ncbi:MAG: S8 family serine peptidase [Burkholderiaceae bacterium]
MNWTEIVPNSTRLPRLKDADSYLLARLDPYLIWADLTNFAGFSKLRESTVGVPPRVPALAKFNSPFDESHWRGLFEAAVTYQNKHFCGGLIPENKLVEFARELDKDNGGFKLGLPAIPNAEQKIVLEPVGGEPEVVFGLVDHACAFLNQAFCDASGKARVVSVWDQDPDRLKYNDQKYWDRVKGFGYGGELSSNQISRLIAQKKHVDEAHIYRQIQYDPVFGSLGHGTHVLDLLAGDPNPLHKMKGLDDDRFDGSANSAPIIFVQLPARPLKDTSGASLCVHVIDALHYIARRTPKNSKLVINLSDGAYAGPHNGESLLERAIDEFLGRPENQNCVVVMAAGNGYEQKGHSEQTVDSGVPGKLLRWQVLPDDFTDSYLEVWLPENSPTTGISLLVKAPGQNEPQEIPLGKNFAYISGNTVIAACISTTQSPNAPGWPTWLLALGPTRRSRPGQPERVPALHGVWDVQVKNDSGGAITFNARIERDNPALGDDGPRRQSYFLDDSDYPRYVTKKGTLNNVATGKRPVVVGGCYVKASTQNPEIAGNPATNTDVAPYSSSGPGRAGAVPGPDVIAPSEESVALHGLRAAANRSGATFRMNGTSVAAPIVARRIANLWAINSTLNAEQVKQMLIDNPPAPPDLRRGWGRVEPGEEPVEV